MNKLSLVILMTLAGLAGTANAQGASGITESTDPAKIAAIEQRAQALGHQQSAPAAGTMMHSATPVHQMEAGKMHHGKKHHAKKHHGKKHHSLMRGDRAEAAAAPMPLSSAKP